MKENAEFKINGLGVSEGVVHGNLFHLSHMDAPVRAYTISETDIDNEISRFQEAIIKTRKEILSIKENLATKISDVEAAIFDAHLMVLEDVAILQETYSLLRTTLNNVEYCYVQVVERFLEAFSQIDDDFMRERVTDVKDVSRRVLNNLMGVEKDYSDIKKPIILACEDFSPSDFSLIEKKNILAIVSEKGSRTSHTAIIARSMNIPCVVGIDMSQLISHRFEKILVDGYKGLIICSPSAETLHRYSELESMQKTKEWLFNSSLPFKSETIDGYKFRLCMNVSGPDDIPESGHIYSDGIGLLRTENLFIEGNRFIDEDTQFECYKKTVEAMHGKPVVIRTLDLGGDKTFGILSSERREENPFLGYRAIRFCLDHEDIFLEQLSAILRASAYGKVKILYPMISCLDELLRANKILEKAKENLLRKKVVFDREIEVGVMLEVPSLASVIDTLEGHCSFLSIGTNDLIQYLIAVDRVNEHVAHLYDPCNPSVIRVLNRVTQDARKSGLKVSICGEMASEAIYAPILIGLGINELSMNPTHISVIKFFLRKLCMSNLETLRDEALVLKTSEEIYNLLHNFYAKNFIPYVNYEW